MARAAAKNAKRGGGGRGKKDRAPASGRTGNGRGSSVKRGGSAANGDRAGAGNGSDSEAARSSRGMGRGGRRLAEAFVAVEELPVLAQTRHRLETAIGRPAGSTSAIAEVVESDLALAVCVLRADGGNRGPRGPVWAIPEAVEALTPKGVAAASAKLDTYELFEPPSEWKGELEALRRHGLATKHAAVWVAEVAGNANWNEIAVAALLHDIGRLALTRLYPDYSVLVDHRSGSPEERVRAERRELGIDHALVGGVLTRRWGLPTTITSAVERHHAGEPEGPAAVIALADQIAHFGHGDPIAAERVTELASCAGIDPKRAHELLIEFPHAHEPRKRAPDPCPLSGRELDALRGLAAGKVYKEIADDLSLSASTVRTHLHNVYRKLGAIDRAQAVLIARDRGWL